MENNNYLYPMEVICAWCGCHMKWGACHLPEKVSHGICDHCKQMVYDEIEEINLAKGISC